MQKKIYLLMSGILIALVAHTIIAIVERNAVFFVIVIQTFVPFIIQIESWIYVAYIISGIQGCNNALSVRSVPYPYVKGNTGSRLPGEFLG